MSNLSVSELRQRAFPAYVQDVLIHIGNSIQQNGDSDSSKLLPLVSEFVLHTAAGSAKVQCRTLTHIQELQLVNLLSTQFSKWYDSSQRVRGYKVFTTLFGTVSRHVPAGGGKPAAANINSNITNNEKVLALLTQLVSLSISLDHTAVLHYTALRFMSSRGASDMKCMKQICQELFDDFSHISPNDSQFGDSAFSNLTTLVTRSEPFACLFITVFTCHLYSISNIMKESKCPPLVKLIELFNRWLSECPGVCFTNLSTIIHTQSTDVDDISSKKPAALISHTPIPGLIEWCLLLPHLNLLPTAPAGSASSGPYAAFHQSISQLHLHVLQAMCSYPDFNLPDDILQDSKVTTSVNRASVQEEGEVDRPCYLNWADLIRIIKLIKSVEVKYASTSSKEMIDCTWERLVQLLHVATSTRALKSSEDSFMRAKTLLPKEFRDLLELQISS